MKKIFGFIFLINLLVVFLYAESFELQNVINKKKFQFYFPNKKIEQIDIINCAKLKKGLRPKFWPDRIPFCIGANTKANEVYYIYYNSFLNKQIITINNKAFKKIADLCVNQLGEIFVIDEAAAKLFIFKVSAALKSAELVQELNINEPKRCEINKYGTAVYVIDKNNNLNIFRKMGKEFVLKDVHKLNNNNFIVNPIRDITISRDDFIYLLTEKNIYKLNYKAEKIWKKPVKEDYSALENTFYGDLLLLNSKDKVVDKFTSELDYLASLDLKHLYKDTPKDITVYDTFGYVAVNAKNFGAYFGLMNEVKGLKVEKKKTPASSFYEISFQITMPSKITLTIFDQNGTKIEDILIKKIFKSGTHKVFWRSNLKKYSVKIKGKALYSVTNKFEKEIQVTLD
ncbi:hypothetical protein ACFL2K_03400 [Candidatus Margulisiibacteriota bacterium]